MKLHIETAGDGPTRVALIHGLGADADMWSDLTDLLVHDGQHTVLMPDLRGHGISPRASSYAIDEFVDDLVESLPGGLHAAVGHSLGGALLVRAVSRLDVRRAVYLDPGFRIGLPSRGLGARVFWGLSPLSVQLTMLASRFAGTNDTGRYTAASQLRVARAKASWDSSMAASVFRELTFDPTLVGPPSVPSTLLLSSDGKAVVPTPMPEELAAAGWDIRTVPTVGHPFWLHDATATFDALRGAV